MYQTTATAARGKCDQAYSTDNLKLDSSNNPRHADYKDGGCQTDLSAKRACSCISRTTNTRGPYASVAQLPDDKEYSVWCHSHTNETPLTLAVMTQQDLIHLLLESGANVHFENSHGNTALFRAADSGDMACLEAHSSFWVQAFVIRTYGKKQHFSSGTVQRRGRTRRR